MKKGVLLAILMFFVAPIEAQIFKDFGKKLEERALKKVEQKAEQKVDRHIDKTLDKADRKSDEKIEEVKSGGTSKAPETKASKKSKQVKGAKDFVSGTKILATEDFSQDAVGDFPVNWLTNSSGDIVTISDSKNKWLSLNGKGSFTIKNFNKLLPKNFTFEFDLYASDGFSYYSTALSVAFVTASNLKKDYAKWNPYGHDKDGVVVNMHPTDASLKEGLTRFYVYDNGEELSKNEKSQAFFTQKNNMVRVQFWRQGPRLRMYIDGNKVWDLPDAFQESNYNSVVFYINEYYNNNDDKLYLSNIVLAEAGADTRHKLIETGSFSTNEILFETNKATIKPSSEKILSELGNALKENPNFKVMITGHTDSDGKDADNQKLSEKRAESVKAYLVSKFGIADNRMQTSGKGESEPISDNKSEDGKSQNRRVEFKKI